MWCAADPGIVTNTEFSSIPDLAEKLRDNAALP